MPPPPSRLTRATAASSATSGTAASRARAASVASASTSSISTARAPTLATATKRKLRTFESDGDNASNTTKQAPAGSRAIKPARGRIARPIESVSKPPTRPMLSSRATGTTAASAARAIRPTAASVAKSEPGPSLRIRARPRQDSAPPISTASTSVEGPTKKARIAPPVGTSMSAAVNAAAAAAKKSVSFAVPAPEKENVAPVSRRNTKPGAMNSRPMRRAGASSTAASRSTIAARSTTNARSRIATTTAGAAARGRLPAKKPASALEPTNETPLSPRKNTDLNNSSNAVPAQTNEPNPIDSVPLTLRQSPKKNNRVAALLPLTTTGIEGSGAALPTATTQSLFMSPAKRLPQSQIPTSPQETLFSPAKRGTHLSMFKDPVVAKNGQGSSSDATVNISKSALLTSPAKRPPSPVKQFGSAAGTSQHQGQGHIVSLLFSPAKRSTPAFKLPSSQFDLSKAVPSLPALPELPSSPSKPADQENTEPTSTENEKPAGKPSELLMAGDDTQSDPFRGRGVLFRQAPPLKLPSRKNGGAMSAKEDLTGDIFAPVRRGSANSKSDSNGPPTKRDLTDILEADDVADDVDDNHDGEIEYTIALTEDDEVTDGVTLTDAQIKISENIELLPRNAPRASQEVHREEDRFEREQSSETIVSAGGSAVGFQEEPEDMMTNVANVSLEFVRSHDREDARMIDPGQELSIAELVQADFERKRTLKQEAMEQEARDKFTADQDTTIMLVPEPLSPGPNQAETDPSESHVDSRRQSQTLVSQSPRVEAEVHAETVEKPHPESVAVDDHDEPVQMEVEHEALPQGPYKEEHQDDAQDEPQPLPQPTPTPRRRKPSRRSSGAFSLRKRELERLADADSESESEETRPIRPTQRKVSGTPATSRTGKASQTPGVIRRRSGMSAAGFTPLANRLDAWSPADPHAAPGSPEKLHSPSHGGEDEDYAGDIAEEEDAPPALEDDDDEIEATIQLQLESELAEEHSRQLSEEDVQPEGQDTHDSPEEERSQEFEDHEESVHRDANVSESAEIEMRENSDVDYSDHEADDVNEDEMELGDDRMSGRRSSYANVDRYVDIHSITASFAEREVEAAIEADIDARYNAYDDGEEAEYNGGDVLEDTADEDEDDGTEGINDDDVVGMMNEEDFDDIEVTDEDIALATEADEMSLLEPEDIEVLHRSYQHLEEAMIEAHEIGVYARDVDDYDTSVEEANNASAEDEDTIAYEQEPSEEMDAEPSTHAEASAGAEVEAHAEAESETEHVESDGDVAIDAEAEAEADLEADVSGEFHHDDDAHQVEAGQDYDEDSLMSNTEEYYHEKTQELEQEAAAPGEASHPVEVDEDGDVSLEPAVEGDDDAQPEAAAEDDDNVQFEAAAQNDDDAHLETVAQDDNGEHEMTTKVPPVTPVRFVNKESHTVSKISVTNDKSEESITPSPSTSRRRKSLNTPRSRSRPQRHSISFAPTTPGTIIEGQVSPVTPARPQASWSGSNNLLYTPGRINTTALKGVTVFVDVWSSEGNDASGVFIELLTQMGAKCVSEWSWDPHDPNQIGKIGITHVVFKDGSNRTLDKVREAQGLVHCVGVSWVLDCERDNTWVDEMPYSVDYGSTPRSTRRRTTGAMRRSPNTPPSRSSRRRSSRRQSTVWERTPTDSDSGFRDDDDDTNWQLSPVAATPAPETVARYASMLPPETPSPMERGGGSSKNNGEKRRDMRAPNVMVTPIKEVEEEDGSGAAAAAAAQEEREMLIQQTCPPPKRTSSVKHGISWLSPDKEPKDAMIRLLAARRKSLQFAPKVSSPLSKQWKQREQS